MKHELKTASLAEIVQLCVANGWALSDVSIDSKICEDITLPDEPYVKLFLVHK